MRRGLTVLALLWAAGVFGVWFYEVARGEPISRYYQAGLKYTLGGGFGLLAYGAFGLALWRRSTVWAGLFAASTAAAGVAYSAKLWVSSPGFSPPLLGLLLGTLIVAAAAGVGRLILRSSIDDLGGPMWRLVTCAALGLGAYALAFLALGMAGLYRPWTAWVALVAGLAAAPAFPWRSLASLPARARAALTPLRIALLAPLVPTLIFLALRTAAPVIDHDSLQYHLGQPAVYLREGGLRFHPEYATASLPANAEMLHVWGMLLADETAARTVNAWAFIGALAALYRFARRWTGTDGALLAATMFGSMALWRIPLGTAMPEPLLVLFAVLAADLALDARVWPLAAVFGGLAAGTKAQGWIVPAAVGTAVLLAHARRVRRFLAFGALSLLVASPWYARAFVWTGNPVWPLAHGIFGGVEWNPKLSDRLTTLLRGDRPQGWSGAARLPLNVTYRGELFETGLEPFFLGLAPLALVRRKPTGESAMLLAAGLGLAALVPLVFMPRYFLPMIPMVCVAVSAAVAALPGRARAVVLAAVGGVWWITAAQQYPGVEDAPAVAAGVESRDAYLRRRYPRYALDEWANANLPREARVFVTGHAPCFYLQRSYRWGCPSHQAQIDYDALADESALRRRLGELGVTHVILDGVESPIERALAERHGRRLHEAGGAELYELGR